jgi:hypothetical protein
VKRPSFVGLLLGTLFLIVGFSARHSLFGKVLLVTCVVLSLTAAAQWFRYRRSLR